MECNPALQAGLQPVFGVGQFQAHAKCAAGGIDHPVNDGYFGLLDLTHRVFRRYVSGGPFHAGVQPGEHLALFDHVSPFRLHGFREMLVSALPGFTRCPLTQILTCFPGIKVYNLLSGRLLRTRGYYYKDRFQVIQGVIIYG